MGDERRSAFWEHLRENARYYEIGTREELERWIAKEYRSFTGEELAAGSVARVEQKTPQGIREKNVCGKWWTETGIPLLKSRL